MSKIINNYAEWIGKRVAFYEGNHRGTGIVARYDSQDDTLGVKSNIDDDTVIWYHPKQCRLLKKKPKSVMWVRKGDLISEETRKEMNWPAGDLVRIKIIK